MRKFSIFSGENLFISKIFTNFAAKLQQKFHIRKYMSEKKRTYKCTFFRRNFCNIVDIKLKTEIAMFSGQIVKNLLKETGRPTADLSELLYGNRKRSVSNLLGENSNPTAHTLEQMAKFFGVPIDYFFVEDEEQKLTENTPVTVYMRTIIDTQKKLIQDQEERIKNLEKIVELREEEMTLYKNK